MLEEKIRPIRLKHAFLNRKLEAARAQWNAIQDDQASAGAQVAEIGLENEVGVRFPGLEP